MTATDKTPEPDPIMARIGHGIELSQQGKRDDAKRVFTRVWEDIGEAGDPFHRCALAHSMADVQDSPTEELVWDLRALKAADLVTDARAEQGGVCGLAGFFPSLHLNLGEVYRKLGNLQAARQHLELGQAAVGALGADGYGAMIRRGLDALALRLAA